MRDVVAVESATQTQQEGLYELESSEAEMQWHSTACFKTLTVSNVSLLGLGKLASPAGLIS